LVNLDWERAGQDGCNYCMIRTRPVDTEPLVTIAEHGSPTGAYSSRLTTVFDDDQT
jgi:hypothetical protein